ncbi:quinolinate synthase NadA [Mycoplasmatota bacterium]|nr:quinolinate synthase NadA [Mycoplasmatota bacterium]
MFDYIKEIAKLKKEKNAVILAHFYQRPEIQDIADYTGDSLYLSKVARDIDAEMIVFCGVHFMAETAKILSPDKLVILPREDAGCPMADMATATKLKEYKKNNSDTKIVSYVNTTAEIKALSDVCVTSSNAETVIKEFKDEKLMYVPDQNLGSYLKDKFDLRMDLWPGFCYVHNRFNLEDIEAMKHKYPKAKFLAHPEMKLEIVKQADYVGSTKALLEYTKQSDDKQFLVGTEVGIIHQMRLASPDKEFIEINQDFYCRNMKKTRLEDLYNALLNEETKITIPDEILEPARKSLDIMFEITEKNA